jgi:general secretion pathway protein J
MHALPHRPRHCQRRTRRCPRRARGFTLVEVLVSLLVMAVMAALAWQGLDGVHRARAFSQARLEQTLRLNTVLAQWEQDLLNLQDTNPTPSQPGPVPVLLMQGTSLRLVRRAGDGLQVVAWSLRDGAWWRWASPVAKTATALQDQWFASQQLVGTEPNHLRMLDAAAAWQIYFYRNNAWSNAQSSADAVSDTTAAGAAGGTAGAAAGAGAGAGASPGPGATGGAATGGAVATRLKTPEGVRLVLTLGPDPSGPALTRDLALSPQP